MDIAKITLYRRIKDIYINTKDSEWWVGNFHSPCRTKHCALGHLTEKLPYHERSRMQKLLIRHPAFGDISIAMANDNHSALYKQRTARLRAIAFMDDMIAIESGCERALNK